MLYDAKKYGARVALYGRKINNAEHQLTFISYLRAIADGKIWPVEAVKAYHGDLQKLKIKPRRSLEDDLKITAVSLSYDEKSKSVSMTGTDKAENKISASSRPRRSYFNQDAVEAKDSKPFNRSPDFSKMTQQEKLQWNLERIRRSM